MQEFRKELREEQQEVNRFLNNSLVRNYYVTLVATSFAAWTLMFNYGAYNTVFYRTLLAIWVLCTVIFLATVMLPKHERPFGTTQLIGLLLPTLWLISFFLRPFFLNEEQGLYQVVDDVLAFITVLALPNVGYAILIITQGEALRLPWRLLFAMIIIVLVVSVAGYWMGANNYLFLTCEEFAVAGDFMPLNCVSASSGQ
ncbi:MAG: hypothetical protein AAF846_20730 [Chloroflexota bacterium]